MSDGQLELRENEGEIKARKKGFGKSLIFSNMLKAETGHLIDTYHCKNTIENDFQLFKDHTIIRFRPLRHRLTRRSAPMPSAVWLHSR